MKTLREMSLRHKILVAAAGVLALAAAAATLALTVFASTPGPNPACGRLGRDVARLANQADNELAIGQTVQSGLTTNVEMDVQAQMNRDGCS